MVRVQVFNAHPRRRVQKRCVDRYVRRVLKTEGKRGAQVSVVFVDSPYSRRINRRFLGRDHVTDVISFSLGNGMNLEGEIYVNLDRARHQARAFAVSEANEIGRLVIHGALHLVGYDDKRSATARRMKVREDEHVRYWFRSGGTGKDS